MKAVVTVIGKDMVGILAKVSAICADKGANVIEVTQSIMQDMFAMIMMIDISGCTVPFSALNDEFEALSETASASRSTSCTRTSLIPCTESDYFRKVWGYQ